MANSMYWGTVDNAAGWYPYLQNYSIWTYFAERRAGATTPDFINTEWLPWLAQRCIENGNHSTSPDCFLGNTSRAQSASLNLETGAHSMSPDRDSFVVPYQLHQARFQMSFIYRFTTQRFVISGRDIY
jgi:hypothetical protein